LLLKVRLAVCVHFPIEGKGSLAGKSVGLFKNAQDPLQEAMTCHC